MSAGHLCKLIHDDNDDVHDDHEATLFKFGKWIDYCKSNSGCKKIIPERGVVLDQSRDRFNVELVDVK